jgi:ankyrin repeat protein
MTKMRSPFQMAVWTLTFTFFMLAFPQTGLSFAGEGSPDMIEYAREGKYEELKNFIKRGVDVNARDPKGWTALMWASERGHADVARLLLDHGASVNAEVDVMGTALMMAAYKGHLETVKLLLDRGADMYVRNKFGWTALIGACYAERLSVAEELLHRARRGMSQALVRACAEGRLEEARSLLDRGADPNSRTLDGLTSRSAALEATSGQIFGI